HKGTFHPFQWRNWTPQAMLYLKGASKLHNNLTLRLTKNGCFRKVIMICLNIRITTMAWQARPISERYWVRSRMVAVWAG
uniref:Uncharacterized protein n=1 Tax=Gadus morhua TaxID=8049 RepID=A0A8C5ABU4_GADMO